MGNEKKLKMKKLNFYTIDDNYIEYLSEFDKHIAYNKNQNRPYIGIVITIDNHYYFAPLFSPKQKHKTYKSNLSFFKIINPKNKNNLGIIRFSNMIPVPLECVNLLDIKNKSYGYKRLLSEQYSYINKTDNKKEILEKSKKIYDIVTSKKNSTTAKFYKEISCNFKLLEEKAVDYPDYIRKNINNNIEELLAI